MTNRYEQCYEDQSIDDLRDVVKFTDWSIAQHDCDLIEEMTRDQSADPLWFKMRLGRVTASIFSRCVKTSIDNPSKSLLNSIFTENSVQNIPACIYGKEHESNGIKEALNAFRANKHRNVSGRNSGLVISPKHPYLAASPDHIISCDCCGIVTVEVKCPFKSDHLSKEEGINVLINRKPQSSAYIRSIPVLAELQNFCNFCRILKSYFCCRKVRERSAADFVQNCRILQYGNRPIVRNSNGRLAMNHEHPYYYQVQAQIFLCDANYGFFVIWARQFSIFIKVTRNNEFLESNAKKAEDFFEKVIGPEIIGHYYTSRK
ncbi:uncharacterized protein LOC120430793 [Culex pipiens pallens]|uniref:uncharacterized protein LOC120430793 n=1 Tax=Culex pipiens pallens TaxID=42434 RepID=UPI0022AB045E|nr:uncharacterized protein LOC120430793 [Culex pipiens pallens]